MRKTAQTRSDRETRGPAAESALQTEAAAGPVNDSPDGAAARRLGQMARQSQQARDLGTLVQRFAQSPHAIAQRRTLETLGAKTARREDAKEHEGFLQMKPELSIGKASQTPAAPIPSNSRGYPIRQFKTEFKFTTQDFPYISLTTNKIENEQVGYDMEARIDPDDSRTGNKTTSDEQKDLYDSLKFFWNPGPKHWVRGHLLNDHLGGRNVPANLFPITGHANNEHLRFMENFVKTELSQGREVYYRVKAIRDSSMYDGVPGAWGTFECSAVTPKEGNKISRDIHSTPELIKNNAGLAPNAPKKNVSTTGEALYSYAEKSNTQPFLAEKFDEERDQIGMFKNASLPVGFGAETGLSNEKAKEWMQNRKKYLFGFGDYWEE